MNVFEMFAKIALNADEYFDGLKKVKDQTSSTSNDVGNSFKAVSKDVDQTSKSVKDTAKSADDAKESFSKTKDAVEQVKEAVEKTTESADETKKAFKKSEDAVEQVKEAVDGVKEETEEVADAADEAAKKTEKMGKSAKKELDGAEESAKKAGETVKVEISKTHDRLEKLKSVISAVGDGFKTAFKASAAAVTATSTAIVGLAKQSLDAYANYEQLVGGVDKIFGESSAKVQEYANQAFQTAGMSANEYMETVTGFSASLLQGLNGDTEKAAEIADRAIRDMSDNANTYGTDMASIQNAYMGFAKGNFQMLDNLKIGYGGTKEEMQRLISDASTMREEMNELGVTVDSDSMSFDNMINAISVMQMHMKISGTTAKEASGTISGSIGSMKAAWQNFLTGVGSPEQLTEVLVGSVENVSKQLQKIVPRLITGLQELAKSIMPYIPQIVTDFLPIIIDGGTQLLVALAESLPEILSGILPQLATGATAIVAALVTVLPDVLTTLIDAIPDIIDAVGQNSSGLIEAGKKLAKMIGDGLTDASTWVGTNATKVITKLLEFLTNKEAIDSILSTATNIIKNLVNGLLSEDSMNTLWEEAPKIVENIVHAIVSAADGFIDIAIAVIDKLVEYWITGDDASEHWLDLLGAATMIVQAILAGIAEIGIEIWNGFMEIGEKIADFLGIGEYWQYGKKMIDDLFGGMGEKLEEWKRTVQGWGEALYDWLHPEQTGYDTASENLRKKITKFSNFQTTDGLAVDGFSVPAMASGGIVTKPTLALIGEAGAGAVIPLERGGVGGVSIENINVSVNANGMDDLNKVGNVIVQQIDEALRRYQLQQTRGIGGTAWA